MRSVGQPKSGAVGRWSETWRQNRSRSTASEASREAVWQQGPATLVSILHDQARYLQYVDLDGLGAPRARTTSAFHLGPDGWSGAILGLEVAVNGRTAAR